MFRLVPPAGVPIRARDAIRAYLDKNDTEYHEGVFEGKLKALCGLKHCFFFNSGRAALAVALGAMANLANSYQNEVIIPAYTCFSIPAAVAKCGLKIRLVDVNPLTLDYDFGKFKDIPSKNILAIIGCNLLGVGSNWHALRTIARDWRVFLIDDAAQSMGSAFYGCQSGSLGDVGIYSLGRGKSISTYSGGILATDNRAIADRAATRIRNLDGDTGKSGIQITANLLAYSIFLNSRLYWIPAMVPWLKLGETIYDEGFGIGRLSNIQLALGSKVIDGLKRINSIRQQNARILAGGLIGIGKYTIPGYSENETPSYLRLPILFENGKKRERAIKALKSRGISASAMYPSTIRQILEVEKHLASPMTDFPGAQELVDKLLTLPTHSLLRKNDIDTIITCLCEEI